MRLGWILPLKATKQSSNNVAKRYSNEGDSVSVSMFQRMALNLY